MSPTLKVASLIGVAVFGAGCFNPTLPESLSCAVERICPVGQFCDPVDLTCKSTSDGSDAGSSADATGDATIISEFCNDPSIALCLTFEGTIDDGSRRNNLVEASTADVQYDPAGVDGAALDLADDYTLSITNYRPGTSNETIEFWMTAPGALGRQIAVATQTQVAIGAENGTAIASSGPNTARSAALAPGYSHIAVRITDSEVELIVGGGGSTATIALTDGASDPDMTIGDQFGMDAYTGSIDSLRVWTRALSDEEIQAIVDDANK